MKRSEMLIIMAKAIKMNWEDRNIPKLRGSTYIGMSIAEAYKYAEAALASAEEAGMLPPENNGTRCSDPVINIGKNYFDEYVPSRIIIGWENE